MNCDRFKFRVYLPARKRFYDVESLEYRWFNGERQLIVAFIVEKGLEYVYFMDDGSYNTLEQCTGIKDENGKLIFEGDKVNMTVFYFDGKGESEKYFSGYVMWDKGEFVLSQNAEKLEYENDLGTIPQLSWGNAFEIIGNVYEDMQKQKDTKPIQECKKSKIIKRTSKLNNKKEKR